MLQKLKGAQGKGSQQTTCNMKPASQGSASSEPQVMSLCVLQGMPIEFEFSFEKWKFFLADLNHFGKPKFFSFYIFDLVKKSGRKWKKITFVHKPFFQLFPFFAYFFWPNKKVYYMKNVGFPKWLRCAKKNFHFSK